MIPTWAIETSNWLPSSSRSVLQSSSGGHNSPNRQTPRAIYTIRKWQRTD